MTTQTKKTAIDLTQVLLHQARTKLLGVRMTPDELDFIASFAYTKGHTIATFTREALQAHIDLLTK
jgi:hypothetical protein